MTPAFVLGMLFPLFIIILGFGSAAAERENGNLRLLMAQSVRPATLFWGKSMGLWAATLGMALPFFTAGALVLAITGAEGEHWLRYTLILLLYIAYFGCFIHLTLLISAWSGKLNAALVMSLGLWVLICLVIPKAAVNFARQKYPAPTWQAYHDSIREDLAKGVDGHDGTDLYSRKLEEETLKEFGVDSVHLLPFNWDGYIMQKGEEHETYVFQKHKTQLLDIYSLQQGLHRAASIFSPYLLISSLSQQLSGTDVHVYFDFLAAAERYRVQLVGELNKDLTDNFEYGDWGGKRGREFFATNVRFEYEAPPLGKLTASLVPSTIILMLWLLVSGFVAILSFIRLKPL